MENTHSHLHSSTSAKKHGRIAATLTKKQLEQIEHRLKNGEYLSNFYEDYDLSIATIRNILIKNKLTTRRTKPIFSWSRDKNRLLTNLVKDKKSVSEIMVEIKGTTKLDILNQMRELKINRKRGWSRIGNIKPISEKHIELAKKMYSEGYNNRRIAIAIGLGSSGNPRYQNIIIPILQNIEAPKRKLRTGAKKIHDKDALKIVELYTSNKNSISEIAEKYKVSYPAIVHVLKREKIELNKKNSLIFDNEDKKNEIKEYFENGGTISNLADKYDYTVPGIRNVLVRYDLLPNKNNKKNKAIDSVKTKTTKTKTTKSNATKNVSNKTTNTNKNNKRFKHNPFETNEVVVNESTNDIPEVDEVSNEVLDNNEMELIESTL